MSTRPRARSRTGSGYQLRVNPIACDAHGMCAELLPEQLVLDEWGYPVVGDEEVPEELLALARQAVEACPTRALLLERRRQA
jgi:ferredoxin